MKKSVNENLFLFDLYAEESNNPCTTINPECSQDNTTSENTGYCDEVYNLHC